MALRCLHPGDQLATCARCMHILPLTGGLSLQQGRSLIKALAAASEGKPPSGSAAYLANVERERGAKCSTTCEGCWRDPGYVTAALRWVLCHSNRPPGCCSPPVQHPTGMRAWQRAVLAVKHQPFQSVASAVLDSS